MTPDVTTSGDGYTHSVKATVAWLVVLALLAPAAVRAQPASEREQTAFGFLKGMTPDEASAIAPLRLLARPANAFATRNPPPVFGKYSEVVLVISPTLGLCRISASTPGAAPPGDGPLLATVMARLIVLFGAPDPEAEQDPGYLAVWTDPFGESSAVMVSLSNGSDGAVVVVDYYFTNYLDSLAEEAAGE